jgi:hypothetical protein
MEPEVLLAQLRALMERAPDFDDYSPTSREHMMWLGQAHALISRWNRMESISLKLASDSLSLELLRPGNVATIFGVLSRAIADLEINVPDKEQVAFAAGEVYDFFRELNKVIESAETSLFIVDPYLDHTVFDHYLNSRKPDVTVRLLLNKNAASVKAAAEKYTAQHGDILEVRKTTKIHDRVIFVDGYVCWVVGQSLKDAAKAKPTYLSPLSPDIVTEKLTGYEEIWNESNEI